MRGLALYLISSQLSDLLRADMRPPTCALRNVAPCLFSQQV